MLDIISQPAVIGFGAVCAAIGILLCYIFVKKELAEVKQLRARQNAMTKEVNTLKNDRTDELKATHELSVELDEMTKKNLALNSDIGNLQATIDGLQADAGKSKELQSQINDLKRRVPESSLRKLNGVGKVVEEKLIAAGVTNIVDIAEMSQEALDRILDEAQVPKVARKHDIRGQAIALAEAI